LSESLLRRRSVRPVGMHLVMARREDLLSATAVVVVGAIAGYSVTGRTGLALAIAGATLAVWLMTHLAVASVALGLALPYTVNIAGAATSLNASPSDVLLVLIVVGVLAEATLTRELSFAPALRLLLLPVTAYATAMLLVLAYHAGGTSVIKTGQRFELFLVPIIIGAVVAVRQQEELLLKAYLASVTLFAALWPVFHGIGQKNPAGQFIANGIVIIVAVRGLRRWLVCLPVLAFGLLFTESRGAIVGTGFGLVAVLLVQGARSPKVLLARVVPLLILVLIAFKFLPETAQTRTTTFKSGTATDAQYSLHIRDLYRRDANALVRLNPWWGVGVGQYRTGTVAGGDINTDPHQVLLFQRVEGGPLLEGGFIVLVLGSVLLLGWRTRARYAPLSAAAVGVTVATVGHGLVDVYWVRGTPVLGWLLVGMAAAQVGARQRVTQMRREAIAYAEPTREAPRRQLVMRGSKR
jgi:hypothetical protein